jgi:hypothetical protein
MFHYINTKYNSESDLLLINNKKINEIIKIKNKKKIKKNPKICALCLCDENESDLEFFKYYNNKKYILIKQCLCHPDIHEKCMLLFLEKSDKVKCIICNKQSVLLHKKIIYVFSQYTIFLNKIKNFYYMIKLFFIICFKNSLHILNFILVFNFFFSLVFYVYIIILNLKIK